MRESDNFPQFADTLNRLSVLRHLANNVLRDSVEREACEWAANEIQNLRGAIQAQDEREAAAGKRCGILREHHGCDWPDAVADEIERLTAQLGPCPESTRGVTGIIHRCGLKEGHYGSHQSQNGLFMWTG